MVAKLLGIDGAGGGFSREIIGASWYPGGYSRPMNVRYVYIERNFRPNSREEAEELILLTTTTSTSAAGRKPS